MAADELVAAEATLGRLRECYAALRQNLGKVIVGQEETLRLLATGLICGGHTLMVGVPGLAKTLMVKAVAESLGWKFRRIQFTPDLMPADIMGTEILQADESGQRRDLVFHPGPVFANLVLADEINRTPPKTQAALLEAMQEHSVTVSGETHLLPPPFVVVATQNPIEQEGTYPLPEAQLDRFLLSIWLDYPGRESELAIAARPPKMDVPDMEPVATVEEFLSFVELIEQAPVGESVLAYAVDLTMATRPKSDEADDYVKRYVSWGVGPRATQHLIAAAKGWAILDGRAAPEIRDIKKLALPVLRHRLLPNYNALGEGIDAADIIAHLVETVREPVAV